MARPRQILSGTWPSPGDKPRKQAGITTAPKYTVPFLMTIQGLEYLTDNSIVMTSLSHGVHTKPALTG